MVEIRPFKKDINYQAYNYVYEDVKTFKEVLPYMKPMLEGVWNVLLLEPDLDYVKTLVDTGVVPSYVMLTVAVDPQQLEQLYLERPKLQKKEKTSWDVYMELIAKFPVEMDTKAMREIYWRCGPREDKLAEALDQLIDLPYVNMEEVNKRFAPVNRIYARNVVKKFLTENYRMAWSQVRQLEDEIGLTMAFYAMRKATRKLFRAKAKWLRNEQVDVYGIEDIPYDNLVRLYWLFETAASPHQLYIILKLYEGRHYPYVGNQS